MTSKLTREWLQQTIAELESVRDEIPFGIDTNSELELAAFKMALAAMDSEPVAAVPEDVRQALSKMDDEIIAELDAEESACRAAMLAAAQQSPGSEPATVPGKWIPVSERMPELGEIVLTAMGGVVNVGEMECSAANYRFFTSVISGRELPATHWMPLPAAPQELKK